MAVLLTGTPAARAISARTCTEVQALATAGVRPCLAIVRLGEREDDLAYERAACRRCDAVGIAVRQVVLSDTVSQNELLAAVHTLNQDDAVHGVLIFRPLPPQINECAVCAALLPEKDVDGITDVSLAALYAGTGAGFPPCTAAACVELLRHYCVPLKGKRAVVVGRSLVIGRPVSLLLLREDATVTICHSKSEHLPELCRAADVLVVAAGRAGLVDAAYVRSGQTVVDVGIHADEKGALCGDTVFSELEPVVDAITPVPGGVGAVTTAVLASHVVRAARRQLERRQ